MTPGIVAIPITLQKDPDRRPTVDHAFSLAADAILLASLIVAAGLPLYLLPLSGGWHTALVAVMCVAGVALPCAIPLVIWRLRWDGPTPRTARTIALHALGYEAPALVGVAAVMGFGSPLALVSVAVMSYIAGIMALTSATVLGLTGAYAHMRVVRTAAILGTPVIVLVYTNIPAFGVDAIQAWSVPMAVVAAGAFGAARGMQYTLSPLRAEGRRVLQ